MRRTFVDLSRGLGLDDQTICNMLDDYVADPHKTARFETPSVFWIEEAKVVGRVRAVVANVEKNTLFDMLADRNKATLIAYDSNFADRGKVRLITMDRWSVYRQVATPCFPGVPSSSTVSMSSMANDALEQVRKTVRKSVSARQRLRLEDDRHLHFGAVRSADAIPPGCPQRVARGVSAAGSRPWREAGFSAVYDCRTREAAERTFETCRDGLPGHLAPCSHELVQAVENRHQDVFNCFAHHRITNAYAESINSLIKLFNRIGCGFSFEVMRVRMIYDQRARAQVRA